MAFLPLRKAVAELGLHPNTLRKYADDNRIPTIRNAAGQRLFDVDAFKRSSVAATVVCYCRVSSHKQRDDLERQAERLVAIHPNAEIIRDIGSIVRAKSIVVLDETAKAFLINEFSNLIKVIENV